MRLEPLLVMAEVYLETNAKREGESDHDQAPGYGGKEPSA